MQFAGGNAAVAENQPALTTREAAHRETAGLDARSLYLSLLHQTRGVAEPEPALLRQSREFLLERLEQAGDAAEELPEPGSMETWLAAGTEATGRAYRDYVERRRQGTPREYFPTRTHALNFLNAVAPTKLVDGAWLYGLTAHWDDARLRPLQRIYLEELGDGDATLNHVVLYRQLLDQHECDHPELLTAAHYEQGALQLALGYHADEFLPEVIGFNLGYEQLPLHLLITAYELRELGIDPYYFTLHVTIDNSHSGHARRAVHGLLNMLPCASEIDEFLRRARRGAALNHCGLGSRQIIESFDLDATLLQLLVDKGRVGKYLHGDYCRVGGRTVSDWLREPEDMPLFLRALQDTGWIRRGEPAENSRFWRLLQGDKARMFGVFTHFEQQVLRDWISGADATVPAPPCAPLRAEPATDLSGEVQRLRKSLANTTDGAARMRLLRPWLAPHRHHTPAGLFATRAFSRLRGCQAPIGIAG